MAEMEADYSCKSEPDDGATEELRPTDDASQQFHYRALSPQQRRQLQQAMFAILDKAQQMALTKTQGHTL